MKSFLKTILRPVASLRLTVILLALSMIVVFAGTWAQIDEGIWQVQRKYFHSFFCIIDFNLFLPRQQPNFAGYSQWFAALMTGLINFLSKLRFPMLGGYSLIALLLLNLLAAHTVRFKINRKRIGILLIHSGLILLICGEVITSVMSVEQQMTIWQGESTNWAADIRYAELVLIDPSSPDHNTTAVIPAKMLHTGAVIDDPKLPFPVTIERYYSNSMVFGPKTAEIRGVANAIPVTAGARVADTLMEMPTENGTNADRNDFPGAFVTVNDPAGKPQTFLLNTVPLPIRDWWRQFGMSGESPFKADADSIKDAREQFDDPQDVQFKGKHYQIALRFKRYYKPFTFHLDKFTHEVYTGSETPKNYASQVHITDPAASVDRDVKIWMNHPLRFAGETFYQANFDQMQDRYTVLEVVRNPGWFFPYVSCSMVALGLIIHFGTVLLNFLGKKSDLASKTKLAPSIAPPTARPGLLWPTIVVALCVIFLFSLGTPPKEADEFNLAAFGRLPISYDGRVMPLDSLARNSLRIISGKEELDEVDGKTQPATWWLLNVMADARKAADYPVYRVDMPDIISQLGLDPARKRFSMRELTAKDGVLEEQADMARGVDRNKRDLFQRKIIELDEHARLFALFGRLDGLFLAPPLDANADWKPIGEVMNSTADMAGLNPGVKSLVTILDAYNVKKSDAFNSEVSNYASLLHSRMPDVMDKVEMETVFNRVEPFFYAIHLYVLIFLLVCFSWLGWRATLLRTAFWVLAVTLGFHTLGLISRIYLQGRPPVTNLYSSAVFIGWGVGVMCLGLELIYRNGVGTLLAAVIGALTLIIAHHLAVTSESGDTMQMMQAVLDTNFWLATHVVVVTLGYAATFLAGFLAIAYILIGVSTSALNGEGSKVLYRMVYGIVCFAMLFSFVGTILGGIWADQSWGRFWGWDPKENGAVLIVFWNALLLHARWGGLVKARGVMNLAVFGNVVTSWSWFGTNMLGVGLHAYGFMDKALPVLSAFVLTMICIIGIGSLPLRWWRSFRDELTSEPGGFPVKSSVTA